MSWERFAGDKRNQVRDELKLDAAYHEAGHAVVGLLLGWRIEKAFIGNPWKDHVVFCEDDGSIANTDGLRTLAMVKLAGPLARERFRGAWSGWHSAKDLQQACHDAALIVLKDYGWWQRLLYWRRLEQTESELIAQLVTDTKCLIRLHWLAITEIAEYLFEHKQACGAVIGDIVFRTLMRSDCP